ncbi:related to peroxisomal short-chain alcohol dehydrogenase [Cephalotrichum gorgonifer]|uniref:Related to peroxisomal short-chain alcohol dehydrogenase n=1 Tax=Cephalotrichum gorgonifer TaxID=2041049 RepID=A0AAE8MZ26_9PEZI|nr:related to peroxisomal short-chain alcohol dehydrogenase [Cephalotrichum gorgonifer]
MGSFLSKHKRRSAKHVAPPTKVDPELSEGSSGTPIPPAQDIFSFTSKIHHDTYPEIDPTTKSPCAGKAVLVTGSNRGIGLAILLSYARAGATHIALCSRTPCPDVPPQLRDAAVAAGYSEPTILSLTIDVTDQEQINTAAKELEEKWGRLDILINNAGFMAPDAWEPLGRSGWKDWDYCMDVNLMGTARVTRAFLPVMLKGGDKTVVNMASIGSIYADRGGESYSLAKFAVCRLAEFLCVGYKEEGVISYSIHPGGIDTPLARNMPPSFHHFLCDTEALSADSIVFLTSKRRAWLGGRWVMCNWDMPELLAREKEIVEHELLKFKCQGLC